MIAISYLEETLIMRDWEARTILLNKWVFSSLTWLYVMGEVLQLKDLRVDQWIELYISINTRKLNKELCI